MKPTYTGPHWIGKLMPHHKTETNPNGADWIGTRIVERRVPRGHVDILPASDDVGAV